MKEIWKDIPISNLSRVKSLPRKMWNGKVFFTSKEKILKPAIASHGYYTVGLYKSKQSYSHLIHRLMGVAFIPNPKNKPYINHIDNIRTHNMIENLEWCTQKENIDCALRDGYMDNHLGANNHTAKLTEKDVLAIRLNPNNHLQKELALIYNVRANTISKIILRKRWKHV